MKTFGLHFLVYNNYRKNQLYRKANIRNNEEIMIKLHKTLLVLIILAFATTYSYSQPRLQVVGGLTHNFGKVNFKNGPLKKKIQIKNSGVGRLEITDVKPSCGCTTAPISQKILDRGDVATIDVTLNVDNDFGEITKAITLTTTDPQNPKVDILLKADVYKPITLFPANFMLGSVSKGEKLLGKMILTNRSNSDIKVLNVDNTNKKVKFNIKSGDVIKKGEDYVIEGLGDTKESGNLKGFLTLKLSDKDMPQLKMEFFGFVMD